jgi:hypothetical protein
MRRILTLVVAVAALMAVTVGTASAAPKIKTDVCHYDADADAFRLISISPRAVDKHLAHGDGLPGEAVRDAAGSEFDPECGIVTAIAMVAAGSFSANGLVDGFTVYEGPDNTISGTTSYLFGSHAIDGTIWDACLHPSVRNATVWGPATSSSAGAGFLVLTIVEQANGSFSTRARFSTLYATSLGRFTNQCSAATVFAHGGTGSLSFW